LRFVEQVVGPVDRRPLRPRPALTSDLRAVVTYDERMAAAALALGMLVEAPA
jgi:hypothetical protein